MSVLPEAVDLVGALDQHGRLRGPRRRSDRYGLWAVMPWHQPETLRNALDESMQFAYVGESSRSLMTRLVKRDLTARVRARRYPADRNHESCLNRDDVRGLKTSCRRWHGDMTDIADQQ